MCAGLLAARGWPLPPWFFVSVSVVIGAVFGAFNGALIAGLQCLPSIVVTLATMVTLRAKAFRTWLRQGEFVNLPDGAQWFGSS